MRFADQFLALRLSEFGGSRRFGLPFWSLTLEWRRPPLPSFLMNVCWIRESKSIVFQFHVGLRKVDQPVLIAEVATGVGTRRFFVCPITGRNCTVLYLVGERLGSREAFRLAYRSKGASRSGRIIERLHATADRLKGNDGRASAKGARREALLLKLAQLDAKVRATYGYSAVGEFYPELRPDRAADERALVKAKHRRSVRENGLDTLAAYDRALVCYPPFVEEVLSRAEAGLATAALVSKPRKRQAQCSEPIDILEDHARLDVRVLVRRGLFKPSERTGLLLDWGEQPCRLDGVHGFIDLRDEAQAHLALELMCQGEPSYQRLALVHRGDAQREAAAAPASASLQLADARTQGLQVRLGSRPTHARLHPLAPGFLICSYQGQGTIRLTYHIPDAVDSPGDRPATGGAFEGAPSTQLELREALEAAYWGWWFEHHHALDCGLAEDLDVLAERLNAASANFSNASG